MKRMTLTILILNLFFSILTAPPDPVVYIADNPGIRDQRLLNAIIQVESGGNSLQINFSEQAIGLLQIRKVMLNEVNRIVGYEKYTIKDCLDSLKSIEIYWTVQSFWNPTNDFKTGAIIWNGRSKHNHYWNKVKKLI
jgi:hypothetical protein